VTTATARRTATAHAPVPKKTTTTPKPNQRSASAKAATPGRRRPSTDLAGRAAPGRPVEHAVLAAERAVQRNSLYLRIPVLGELNLPAPEQIAFIGGVAVVAVIGLLEWPVAALLVVGHVVATSSHRRMVRALGEALEAG